MTIRQPSARIRRGALAAVLLGSSLAGVAGYRYSQQAAHADEPGVTAATALPAASSFKDVPKSHWSAGAVNSLTQKQIIQGEPKPSGQPVYDGDRFVTRYEAAVMLDRFAHSVEQGREPLHAQSVPDSHAPKLPPSWAQQAQLDLARSDFLNASSPLLQGDGNLPVTQKQFAAALAQVVVRVSDRSLPLTPNAADFDDEDTGKAQ